MAHQEIDCRVAQIIIKCLVVQIREAVDLDLVRDQVGLKMANYGGSCEEVLGSVDGFDTLGNAELTVSLKEGDVESAIAALELCKILFHQIDGM